MKPDQGSILIIGGGIGGIKAAFDAAELGLHVFLADRNPFLGGTLSQLDRQFPTNRCGMCQLLPTVARHGTTHYCLRRELYHPKIQPLPGSELIELSGEAGNFTASLKTTSVAVDPERCTNCGACVPVCPVEVKDDFNGPMTTRKAIYAKYPLPLPNRYVIDTKACTRCGACVSACPTRAIDLDAETGTQTIQVGSVILAAGFEEFDPKILMQYGHGRYPDVLTSIELERMFSGYGAGEGDIFRPSNGEKPRRLAFLQCVGSRDHDRDYCSAACCMYALKEAMIVREQNPDLEIHFFYMDARAYGKGYHKFLTRAQEKFQVHFTRSRIPVVKENPATKKLALRYLTEAGAQQSDEFDLVVLSIGQVPPPAQQNLAHTLGIELNPWGFCKTDEFSQVATTKSGIFACGAFTEPKDIPETVAQASSAALQAAQVVKSAGAEFYQAEPPSGLAAYYDQLSEKRDWESRTAIFVCRCGGELSRSLDTKALTQFAKKLPQVVLSEEIDVLCSEKTLEKVTQKLQQVKASRVVFAACVPYHYRHLFEEAARGAEIDPGYVQIANIREHAGWTHEPAAALGKAKNLLRMALTFTAQEENLEPGKAVGMTPRAAVIGAGAAGMCAALGLANLGVSVDLIEKDARIGGQLNKLYFAPHARDPQEMQKQLARVVAEHPKIQVRLETQIVSTSGSAGNFSVRLKNAEEAISTQNYGALILATGAQEHFPASYEFGHSPKIMTQQQFKEKVVGNEIDPAKLKQVVMIQCVESRNETRPWCSRICCTQAMTNALKIKAANPAAEIVIFNRDIMTYGFREQYYTQVREAGVLFVRYEPGQEPKVVLNQAQPQITAIDPVLNRELEFIPDLLLLSTGIDPNSNTELAQLLNVPLDADGFFQEAEVKFRPVDFHKDGVFVAGLAHSPRFLEESMTQGYAAAARAATLLLKNRLPVATHVAEVNPRRCSGCEMCIPACPYDARVWDEESHTVLLREALCQGCGACAMVCPNNASKLRGYRDRQVMAVIDAGLF